MSFKGKIVKEETIKFFKKMPYFQFLDKSVLKDITNDLTIEFYPRDTVILKQDGPPSDSLRIIKRGEVKVFMEENGKEVLIDYRLEGDTFGFLSLIREEKQETTVVAVDDTACYLLSKEKVLKLIETNPVFTGYFLKTHFSRYIHRAHRGHHKSLSGSDENNFLFITQAGDIATKEVVTVTEDETIQEAAQIMVKNKISSLIILDEKNLPGGL